MFQSCRTKDWEFCDLYSKKVRLDDSTNSGYEFAISCAALCWGLSPGQCLTLIEEWWQDIPCPDRVNHPYDQQRFLRVILPDAVQASQPVIEAYRTRKAIEKADRDAKKTWPRMQALLKELESATPTILFRALNGQQGFKPTTLAAVKMQLKRHRCELLNQRGTYGWLPQPILPPKPVPRKHRL